MRYLLDTCVVSDFIKGHPNVVAKFSRVSRDRIALSSITVMEVTFGLEAHPPVKTRIGESMNAFIRQVHVEPFSQACGQTAGSIRAELKRNGTPMGPFDLLVAATAVEMAYVLVTSNESEFARIPGLRLENWRA